MDLKLCLNPVAFYALEVKRIKIEDKAPSCKIVRESPILGHFKFIYVRVMLPLGNLSKHSLRQWSKEGGRAV